MHPDVISFVNYTCHCSLSDNDHHSTQRLSAEDASTTTTMTSYSEDVTSDNAAFNLTAAKRFSLSDWTETLPEDCVTYRGRVIVSGSCASASSCTDAGWTLVGGVACTDEAVIAAVPDVFLLSCILFSGTFTVAIFLRTFRSTRFFPTLVGNRYT